MARALTVEQAAEFLQVSPYTVRQWLRSGKMPGRKLGRVYRILDTDLEAFVGENRSPAGGGAVRERAAAVGYQADVAKPKARRKRRKLVGFGALAPVGRKKINAASLAGKYPIPGWTLEDFMRVKAAEVEEEERRWEERHRR